MYRVQRLDGVRAVLGEGSLWRPSASTLWWIDIKGASPLPSFNVLDVRSMTNSRFYLPSRVGTVVPVADRDDVAVVALESGVFQLNLTDHTLQLLSLPYGDRSPSSLSPPDPDDERWTLRMNDGKVDPQGRFWVGSMFGREWKDGAGSLYRIGSDLKATSVLSDLTIPNGIVWTDSTLYHIDTPTLRVDAYDYDSESGAISNRRTCIDFESVERHGYPDGMTMDSDGNLWIACFNGSKVVCYSPETGKQLHEIPIPTPQVTSVAFGGADMEDLYVTTGAEDLTDEQLATEEFQYAGQCFKVTGLGVTGLPPSAFAISPEALAALSTEELATVPTPTQSSVSWAEALPTAP